MPDFDDARLQQCMREYVHAVDALSEAAGQPDAKEVLDRAERKTLAGMALRRALLALGWTPPRRPAEPAAPPAEGDVMSLPRTEQAAPPSEGTAPTIRDGDTVESNGG